MPGMTKKALHELLLHRHGGDEPPVPGYNAFTHYLRRNGISPGAGLPRPTPGSRRSRDASCSSTGRRTW